MNRKEQQERKHPAGSTVQVKVITGWTECDPVTEMREATVVRHGYDEHGIYTRVRFADGSEENYHRSALTQTVFAPDSPRFGRRM